MPALTTNNHEVVLGVDTQLDAHVGAVLSETGNLLGTLVIPVSTEGYQRLLACAMSYGELRRAGVEGTGTYGAGLTRILRKHGVEVLEINRPDRAERLSQGKSDPTDADSAARAVLSGKATAIPKTQSAAAESMRAVLVARRNAVKARTQAINQIKALLICSPQALRERLWRNKPAECIAGCLRLRERETDPLHSLSTTLRLLAKRWLLLDREVTALDAMLERLTQQHAKRLRSRFGIGPQTAATLLGYPAIIPSGCVTRRHWRPPCGVSPLSASSGKTIRHRLNRGSDRSANDALRTKAYAERRTREGRTTREIHLRLKRYTTYGNWMGSGR